MLHQRPPSNRLGIINGKQIDNRLKKNFSSEKEPVKTLESRDCFRLNLIDREPFEVAVRTNDGSVNSAVFCDISASGFSCEFPDRKNLKETESVSVLFILPLEELYIIRTKACLVVQSPSDPLEKAIHRFKFSDGIDENIRERIHRYIILKQFETIKQQSG